jgi:predicted outer membrane protein
MALAAPQAARAQGNSTSAGNVALFSQKNLVHHIIVNDSVVLEMAQLAAKQTKNAAVKDYANALIADRTKYLESLRKVAESKDVGREANASDSSSASAVRALTELQKVPADSGFDEAFLKALIGHHEREIASLKQLRTSVKDSVLQLDLDNAVSAQEQSLTQAKAILAKLAMPADTTKKRDSTFKRFVSRRS